MALDKARIPQLARDIYAKPAVTRADFCALLEVARASGDAPQELSDLLSQVGMDLFLNQVLPNNYLQAQDADWLIDQLRAGPALPGACEYELLTHLLRNSLSVPPQLAAFTVAEIERTVIGRLSAGRDAPGVTAADIAALRTAVFATAEGSSLHVTRESAEALFRIAQAAEGATNDSGFEDFFAKAIGNYLMGVAHRWTSTAAARREIDQMPERKQPHLKDIVANALGVGWLTMDWKAIGKAFTEKDVDGVEERARREMAEDASAMQTSNRVDDSEAVWLAEQILRDGKLSRPEKALLEFLQREAPEISPKVQELLGRQAA